MGVERDGEREKREGESTRKSRCWSKTYDGSFSVKFTRSRGESAHLLDAFDAAAQGDELGKLLKKWSTERAGKVDVG